MNKYVRAVGVVGVGTIKMLWTKLFHLRYFSGPLLCMVSPFSEILLENRAELRIGKMLKLRDGGKIRVRKGGKLVLGDNVSVGSNSMIICHESITIGSHVQLAPNVQIYDHDHDFRAVGGLKAGKFCYAPVTIGNNVWIGSNCVILRGSVIGDNAVIAAGSVVKGTVPANSVCIQKRVTDFKMIDTHGNDSEKL